MNGTLPLGKRPEGQRLLTEAQAKRFDTLIVHGVNRLGRTVKTFLEARDQPLASGVTIKSAIAPFDTPPQSVSLLFCSWALWPNSTGLTFWIASRWAEIGWCGGREVDGRVPYGYKVKDGRLVLSSQMVESVKMTEAEMIAGIFHRIAAGATLIAECCCLNSRGVPVTTRYGDGTQILSGCKVDSVGALLYAP